MLFNIPVNMAYTYKVLGIMLYHHFNIAWSTLFTRRGLLFTDTIAIQSNALILSPSLLLPAFCHESFIYYNFLCNFPSSIFVLRRMPMDMKLSHDMLYQVTECLSTLRSQLHQKDIILEKKKKSHFSVLIYAILDTTSISEESRESGTYKISHIVYASVGLCCPFFVICACWWRYYGK